MNERNWFDDYNPVIRYGTWDINILKEQENYSPLDIQEGDVVLDLGGHIGGFMLWSLQFKPCRIISLEPHIENYRLYMLNIPENHVFTVKPFNKALIPYDSQGWNDTILWENLNSSNTGMHSLIPPKGLQDTLRNCKHCLPVTTTLKRLMQVYDPDIIKCDIEGMELYIDWLELSKSNVKRLVIEFHFQYEDENDRSKSMNIVKQLKKAGYKTYRKIDWSHAHQQLGFFERVE